MDIVNNEKNCVVCFTFLQKENECRIGQMRGNDGKKLAGNAEGGAVKEHLDVAFLLRKVLDICDDVYVQFLRDCGNLDSWINCCESCSALLHAAKSVFSQIAELQKQFENLQKDFKNKIVLSMKEKDIKCETRMENMALEIIRSYVIKEFECANGFNEIPLEVKIECTADEDEPESILPFDPISDFPFKDNSEDEEMGAKKGRENKSTINNEKQFSGKSEDCGYSVERSLSGIVKSSQKKRTELISELFRKKLCNETQQIPHIERKPPQPKVYGKRNLNLTNMKSYTKINAEKKPYEAAECSQRFHKLDSLNGTKSQIEKSSLKCELCEKVFESHSDLARHEITHSTEILFKCKRCEQAFKTPSDLDAHEKAHEKCDLCGMGFPKVEQLDLHKKYHCESAIKCDQCRKSFKGSYGLNKHITNAHINADIKRKRGKERFCKICNKEFDKPYKLRVHERLHTGEKPYLCEICKKEFRTLSALKVHKLRNHLNEKPFSCETCEKAFASSYDLRVHEECHITEKSCKCEKCGKSFTCPLYLQRHISYDHGNDQHSSENYSRTSTSTYMRKYK